MLRLLRWLKVPWRYRQRYAEIVTRWRYGPHVWVLVTDGDFEMRFSETFEEFPYRFRALDDTVVWPKRGFGVPIAVPDPPAPGFEPVEDVLATVRKELSR